MCPECAAGPLASSLGAPDLATARAAAAEEVAFAATLCDHPPQTLLALHRTIEDGEIRERFRTLTLRDAIQSAGASNESPRFQVLQERTATGAGRW